MTRISTFLLAVFALNIAQIPSTALANAYEKSAFLKKFGYQDAKISRAYGFRGRYGLAQNRYSRKISWL